MSTKNRSADSIRRISQRHSLYKYLTAVLVGILLVTNTPADPATDFQRLYGQLLQEFWRPTVQINGIETTVFDYEGMQREFNQPDSVFHWIKKKLKQVDEAQFENENAAKAFWINVYNFAAMRLVTEHYPVDSIRSFRISLVKYPWSKKAIQVGRNHYTLKQIEKEILLAKFEDSRIVFAVSCAAVSCPDRGRTPFSAHGLDDQLDELIREFFRNPNKGLRLDRSKKVLTLSWILNKDRDLFERSGNSMLDFVRPYLGADIRDWLNKNSARIEFLEHDWTLNDIAKADNTSK